jgi:ribonuclease H / adenosylcobalamin/alpha-ribazole phosphatase
VILIVLMILVSSLSRSGLNSISLARRSSLVHGSVRSMPLTRIFATFSTTSSTDISEGEKRRLLMQFDGGSRGNPGVAGAGAVIYSLPSDLIDENKKELWYGYFYLGDKITNNQAEYSGLIYGLKCLSKLRSSACASLPITIQGDSELILKQMRGEYKVKNKQLLSLYTTAKSVQKEIVENGGEIVFEHIPRDLNSRADELSNIAMDEKNSAHSAKKKE